MFVPSTVAPAFIPEDVQLVEAGNDIPPVAQWLMQVHGFATVHEALRYMLFSAFDAPVPDGKLHTVVRWVPGGLLQRGPRGPQRPAQVMLISKMPSMDDVSMGETFFGSSGRLMREIAEELGVDISSWYVTNVCRFVPPGNDKTLKKPHLDICRWLLRQEINLVQPKYLLLLGADAVKAVCGKSMKITNMRSHYYSFDNFNALGTEPKTLDEQGLAGEYGVKVMATLNPGAVLMEGGYREGFVRDLELFRDWTRNRALAPTDLSDRDYRYVSKRADLRRTIDEIKAKGLREISIDAEWVGGDYRSCVVRTIQFSWAEKTACVVILANLNGQPHLESVALMQELSDFINGYRPAIIGHAARADGRVMEHRGLHIMRLLAFDTMLADHALNENAEHDLGSCATRYTDMGRYDVPMYKWMDNNGITAKFIKLHGFKGIPDDFLLPYAACDADCTFRVARVLRERLQQPGNEGPRRCYEQIILPTNLPINEIEMAGISVDVDRMEIMTTQFAVKKIELLEKVRTHLNMPGFNPRSTPQMQGLLFGKPEAGGFGLTPYKTTGKPSKMWAELGERDLMRANAATDMETLEFLSDQNPVCSMLRDFKIIDQITKTFLREAEIDEETDEAVYTGGLLYELDDDGRIRTTISQMSETGRWKSSRPNCLPDYGEVLTDRGWVFWPDVKSEDLLGQCELKTQEVSFAKPLVLYSYDFTGQLVQLSNDFCKMVTTADHRFYIQSRYSKNWRVFSAQNYPSDGNQPRAGIYKGGLVKLTTNQISFIGTILSGATLNVSTLSIMLQDSLSLGFEALLRDLNIQHGKMSSATRNKTIFEVSLADISAWCPARYVTLGPWIFELDKDSLIRLFDFLYANLFVKKNNVSHVLPWRESQTNFDWWQILATLCGATAYPCGRLMQGSVKVDRELYIKRRSVSASICIKKEKIDYTGKVYCAQMPFDTLIVRQNGFVSIVGNCQNFPKKQDKAIKRIMGNIPTIRSCFIAKPGHVLIEADYKSAEIYTLGFLSNCMKLLRDAEGDLHARGAVSRFGAPAWVGYDEFKPPPEEWLVENSAIRVASKTVTFGIPYQRGAAAIARQIMKETTAMGKPFPCDMAKAKGMIEGFYSDYNEVGLFVQMCKDCVRNPGYLENPMGRRRRFFSHDSQAGLAAQERECVNFPIQGTVADLLNIAMQNFYWYRELFPGKCLYDILLAIHDAGLFEVPIPYVPIFVEEVLPQCMKFGATVPSWQPTSNWIPTKPFNLDIDISLFTRWGQKPKRDELHKLGLSDAYVMKFGDHKS